MTKRILREPPDRDQYYVAGSDPRDAHRANYRFTRYSNPHPGADYKRFHAWVNGWTWANTGEDDNDQES